MTVRQKLALILAKKVGGRLKKVNAKFSKGVDF